MWLQPILWLLNLVILKVCETDIDGWKSWSTSHLWKSKPEFTWKIFTWLFALKVSSFQADYSLLNAQLKLALLMFLPFVSCCISIVGRNFSCISCETNVSLVKLPISQVIATWIQSNRVDFQHLFECKPRGTIQVSNAILGKIDFEKWSVGYKAR